jgi:hypothetical protein
MARKPSVGSAARKASACPGHSACQHRRVAQDVHHAERRERDEPDTGDRPEADADARRAMALDPEQCDQDAQRDRHDVVREQRRRDFQAFDRRQHRDGRRDQAVAVEQRGAEQAEQDHRHAACVR